MRTDFPVPEDQRRKIRRAAVLLVAATTGLRQGELRGLCWPDIDLEAGTIRLARQLARVVDSDGIVGDGEGVTTRHWDCVPSISRRADQLFSPSLYRGVKEHHEAADKLKCHRDFDGVEEQSLFHQRERPFPFTSRAAECSRRHLPRPDHPGFVSRSAAWQVTLLGDRTSHCLIASAATR